MKRLFFLCACLILLAGTVDAQAAPKHVVIGTGALTGVYYPVGGAISSMMNKHRFRTTVESTDGSLFNINALMSGDIDFGIVQADLQHQAYKGFNHWAGAPQSKLRAVFALHPEIVTILAAADKNIKTVTDLKGKTVNIGQPGSGQRSNAMALLEVAGIDVDEGLEAEGFEPDKAVIMLQDKRIDAYFYTVGHPNELVRKVVAGSRALNFVAVPDEFTIELIRQHPFYVLASIPVKHYPGVENKKNTPSYGVKATLCTSADVADKVVYALTKEIFANLETFRSLHPALEVLTRENMLEGLSAPLHPGAEQYYREAGLL